MNNDPRDLVIESLKRKNDDLQAELDFCLDIKCVKEKLDAMQEEIAGNHKEIEKLRKRIRTRAVKPKLVK